MLDLVSGADNIFFELFVQLFFIVLEFIFLRVLLRQTLTSLESQPAIVLVTMKH